jgi:hypothetical protein
MTFIISIPTNNKRKKKSELEDAHDELKSLLGNPAGLVVTDAIEYTQEQ